MKNLKILIFITFFALTIICACVPESPKIKLNYIIENNSNHKILLNFYYNNIKSPYLLDKRGMSIIRTDGPLYLAYNYDSLIVIFDNLKFVKMIHKRYSDKDSLIGTNRSVFHLNDYQVIDEVNRKFIFRDNDFDFANEIEN